MTLAALLLAACRIARQAPAPESLPPVYSLDVRLRPVERVIEVSGTLLIPGDSIKRDSLILSLSERMNTFAAQLLEPAASRGPAVVQRVMVPTGPRVTGERRSSRWVLRPAHPIPRGERVRLRFSYAGSGDTSFIHYIGPEVAFASGWGDLWYPTVSGVGGLGTGELTVHSPPGWRVITGSEDRSTTAEQDRGTFRFAQRDPTYFTFVAGRYSIVRHETRKGPAVTAWLLSARPTTQTLLQGASSMVEILSTEFGPFPFGTLALVEVPRSLAQAAGFNAFSPVGFLVLNSRAFDVPDVNRMLEWLGHEMGHQWFPHAVTFDPPGFQYLEEALAEYGGIRVVEELGGVAAARRLRTTGFEFDPIYSATAFFRLVADGVDEPLATMGNGINERNLAYNKGGFMFDMLSREVGPERFRDVLRRLTTGKRLASITWTQFRAAVNARAGQDMEWFYDQWLNRAGAPDFKLSWRQEGKVIRGTIAQPEPYYRAQLRVDAIGAGGERATTVVAVGNANIAFEMTPGFTVDRVELDPNYEVLRWTPEFRALVDSLRQPSNTR